jgi:FkbM family methyltransferase
MEKYAGSVKIIDSFIGFLSRRSNIFVCRDHHFLNRLDAGSLVVDLGAHKGEFSAQIVDIFGSQCICVEADPALYSGIAEGASIKKYNFAVCDTNGPVQLYLSENPEATSIKKPISDFWGTKECVQTTGIQFEKFLDKCGIKNIDLLKADIEGAEIELFRSTSSDTILGISQIAVEFHTFLNPAMEKEVLQIKARLRNLGFLCLPFPYRTSSALDCDTLFVNRGRIDLSVPERISIYALRGALHLRILALKCIYWKNRFKSLINRN